jgi:3-methyladenine DNA glycosylase AlkD
MDPYLLSIIDSFHKNANGENAFWMKKYMKEKFEFLGIKKPERAELQKEFFATNGVPSTSALPKISMNLFELEHREFQYFALDLLHQSAKNWDEGIVEIIEDLIITKSWWDTVDLLAGKLAGKYFLQNPEKIPSHISKWNTSNNFWLVRASILFQLNYKEKTNQELLFSCILPHVGSNEFFIQKAIGWALRQYARTNPKDVLTFVETQQMKPLSKREALKHFG